jgi:FtsZ-interacting cell division protein ZipA
MKKNGSSSKGRKSGSGFAGVRRRRFWKKHGGVVITLSAILVLAVVGIWAISATNKNTAERMSSQLATVQPTPTPTEVVVLDGITIAKAETEEATEATPTEVPEVTEEAEEEGEEEVAEAEESEEATEATPSATAQPTQAQQQQATAQPTQAQQVVTTTATSGNSWSWSYHNDNGQVTVSTSGQWPEGVDPNDPNSVYQWMLQNTGINPYFFQ